MANERTRQIEDVRGSGIYPATGPAPSGHVPMRTAGEFGHPEQRRALRTGPSLEKVAFLAGRAIFGGFFVYNGINHFRNRQTMAGYAGAKGVPAPGLAVLGSGVLALAGGLSTLTGAWPKAGAGMIATFLLGVSKEMHAFWKEEEPQRGQDMVSFTKNMALVGAALIVAAYPEPWPWHVPIARRGGALVRVSQGPA